MVSWNTRNGTHLNSFFLITKSLDLSAHNFFPIAYDKQFSGTIDGNGCVLEGLTIVQGWCGLVERMNGGTIKNLGIVGATVNRPYAGGFVGSFCGYMENGSLIDQCFISDSTIITDATYVGGMVGYCSKSTINNSFVNKVTITANGTEDAYEKFPNGYTMGLSPSYSIEITSKTADGNPYYPGYIYNVRFNGQFKIKMIKRTLNSEYVGGLIGKSDTASANKSTVSNSYFAGTINGYKLNNKDYHYTTPSGISSSFNIKTSEGNYSVGTYSSSSSTFQQFVSKWVSNLAGYSEEKFSFSGQTEIGRSTPTIMGSGYYVNQINCYYNTSSNVKKHNCVMKTASEFKNLAAILGSSYFTQADHINGGYPFLKQFYWEATI